MAGLDKGDIVRLQHGVLSDKPVTYITVKNEEIKKKLENSPDILGTGEKNGELWLAVPRETRIADFINKATAKVKKLTTASLKKELINLGIPVIGNFVKRKDVVKFLSKRI